MSIILTIDFLLHEPQLAGGAVRREADHVEVLRSHLLHHLQPQLRCRNVKRREKREIPEKNHQSATSSCTIPTCENPGVTRPGIEPGSPLWEARRLTAQPPRPLTFAFHRRVVISEINIVVSLVYVNTVARALELPGEVFMQSAYRLFTGRRLKSYSWESPTNRLARRGDDAVHEQARVGLTDRASRDFELCCRQSEPLSYCSFTLSVQGQEARERYGRQLHALLAASSLLRPKRAVFPSNKLFEFVVPICILSGGVVRLLASHLGEPGSLPDFRMWESCRTTPLVGRFSRGSPVSPVPSFQRCSTLTSLHPHRLSRPRRTRAGTIARGFLKRRYWRVFRQGRNKSRQHDTSGLGVHYDCPCRVETQRNFPVRDDPVPNFSCLGRTAKKLRADENRKQQNITLLVNYILREGTDMGRGRGVTPPRGDGYGKREGCNSTQRGRIL
ncbi:hypothetical protein PR048_029654 [Dryococelus australis]|uniref:Uncharacterized protein n=1 Tax=Dryococelus australis TaxID=614101 RepID=A0ABQ9GGG1_9NEOP|nr:hypothetical protein PR048_029654 [Dryococelus australis]